jgi:hypothetical protein
VRHDAAHRLRQHVLPVLVRIGPFGPNAGADGKGDARIDRRQRLVAEPHTLHDPGAEVVDDDIAAFDEPADDGASRFRPQVQRDAALVAVEAAENRVQRTGRVLDRPARQIARAKAFDLDHVGAPVTKHLRAARAEHDLREVDDLDPFERQTSHGVT